MKCFVAATCTALLVSVSSPASADTFVFFDVPLDHCVSANGACGGTTTHVITSAGNDSARVIVTRRVFGENAFGFNLVGPSDGLTITFETPGYTLSGNNETIGPFGSFEYVIDAPPRTVGALALVFTLTRDAGFLSGTEILAMNEFGFLAAGHIFQTLGPAGDAFVAGDTAIGHIAVVPEPGSMALLGSGLLVAWRARRRSAARLMEQ